MKLIEDAEADQRRVLVVEDRDGDAASVRHALRSLPGVDVHRVVGEAELSEALEGSWDLVLTDDLRRGLDAERVLELVQATDDPPRVVVVSGAVGEERAVEMVRRGAVDFVPKDDLSRLPSVVEREIADGRRQRQLARAQAELEHQSKRMRSLLAAVPDELVVVSTDGVVRDVYGGDEGVVGAGAVGQRLVDVVAPEAAAPLMKLLSRVGDGHEVVSVELPLEERRVFDARARYGDEGEIVLAIRDISAQRMLEHQMLATQRMEAVGRLAAGVAHDFNNIITVVRSYADLVAQAIDGSDRQACEDLEVIIDAADRASRLTSQLLAFSRRQVREVQIVDVNDAIVGLQKMLKRLIGEDVIVIMDLAPNVPPVVVDPAQLDQVVLNLAVNARDAMPRGGTLTIVTAARDDRQGRRWAQLSIADDGEGMDPQTRQRIFEPFFTTKQTRGGTGLGLSTVYGIIRQSGGVIDLETVPGEGTTFTVSLPAAEHQQRSLRPPRPSPTTLRGRERIIVAEDDPHLGRATRRLLQKHGYDCRLYSNGRDALEALENDGADLLVTDLVMPEMDGVALSRRARESVADLPCLFVSGYADESIAARGLELGPTDVFLRKPFSRQQLLEMVREALERGTETRPEATGT